MIYWLVLIKNEKIIFQLENLSTIGFWKRGTMRQIMSFITKQVASNSDKNSVLEEGEYRCFCSAIDELKCVIITDQDYPMRIGLDLCIKALKESDHQTIKNLFNEYQVPDNLDNLKKINDNLNETKDVLIDSLLKLIERQEKIETLIEKSDDLNRQTKDFLISTRRMNSCCKY